MIFLTPLALLGLVAALVPPLLHLFQRREPPVIEFPAVRYLQETQRDAQRTVRLQHLLLMLLRILGVVLLVLAAARPVVPGGLGGHHAPTALVLIFDHSLSSGAVQEGTRVRDDLALRARETLREAQAGDAVWLIGADGIARRGAPDELRRVIDELQPDQRRLDLTAAVRLGARLIATSGFARGEIHVLSDLQASAVVSNVEGQRSNGDTSTFDLRRSTDSSLVDLSVLVYHPPAAPPPNLGVSSARPWPALWVSGSGGVRVTIGGTPGNATSRGAVSLTVDGRPGARSLAVAGAEAMLAAPSLAPGWHLGRVALEPDELRGDDERPLAVRVVPPAVVMAAGDLGPFAMEALGVLAGAGRIRLSGATEVRLGGLPGPSGASIVLPPADPSALGATNRALAAAGVPWRFGARLEREDSLVAPAVPELAGARVRARYRLEPSGGETATDVLARAGGDAWLVRHGRIVVLGSRLLPEETTLPLTGAFVPFVGALANRVARGESGVIESAPGEAVVVPDRVNLMSSGDSSVPVRSGDVLSAPAVAGVWALRSGRDTVGMLVVAPDPRESDLARATSRQLGAAWPRADVTVTEGAAGYAARRFRGAGRSELTGWLLLVALAVLVSESLLAAGGLGKLTLRR